jgi:hypothetical protein
MSQPKTSAPAAGVQPGSSAVKSGTGTAPMTGGAAAPRSAASPARAAGTASRSGAALPAAAPAKGAATPAQPESQIGKVVHDERGNAVWDWLKQTGRNAIESTTRMLRKLESPELKVEQTHEEELRIQPDNDQCAGGGYDPYNQPIKSRRTPPK